jgi:hypothetical protein
MTSNVLYPPNPLRPAPLGGLVVSVVGKRQGTAEVCQQSTGSLRAVSPAFGFAHVDLVDAVGPTSTPGTVWCSATGPYVAFSATLLPTAPPDTTPPTVKISSPSDGSNVVGVVNIAADASDDVGVVGVQFQVDGTNVGTEDTTTPYAVPWDSQNYTLGVHALTAVARDAAGNTSTTATNIIVANLDGVGTGDALDGTGVPATSACGGSSVTEAATDIGAGPNATDTCQFTPACRAPAKWVILRYDKAKYSQVGTGVTFFEFRAQLSVCLSPRVRTNHGEGPVHYLAFCCTTQEPAHMLSPFWSYLNDPRWDLGPTGKNVTQTWAKVTASFEGCPFTCHIISHRVTVIITFILNADGTFSAFVHYP